MNDLPKRKNLRLKEYNYSDCGLYFVTLCLKDGHELLWNNAERDFDCTERAPELSEIGRIIDDEIKKLRHIYVNVTVDKYCIMPNHIHMIILKSSEENIRKRVELTLSRIIKQFKGSITKRVGFSIWQKSYYDRIIRNEYEYFNMVQYIDENVLKWVEDELNVGKNRI